MQELTKMIDNTKKIKEFHETLAFEKFSNNNAYRQGSGASPGKKPTSKMAEEQQKLKDKEIELINTKKKTVHLNFCKLVLLKKQSELNKIIEKVKKEEYNKAWHLYWDKRNNEGFDSEAAFAYMNKAFGGVPRKQAKAEKNILYLEKLNTLFDLVSNSILKEVSVRR